MNTNYIESLPVLELEISGEVKNTNISAYEESAILFISNINSELSTDEDFATAESNVKFCGEAEKQLAEAKKQALSQTASISDLFDTIDRISGSLRSKRLELNKLVTTQKANVKADIVSDGTEAMGSCTAMLFISWRIQFVPGLENEHKKSRCGAGTVLFAYGKANADALKRMSDRGIYLERDV